MQSDATEGTLLQNAVKAGYNISDIEEKEVTKAEYAAITAPTAGQLIVQSNSVILSQIIALEQKQLRPLREYALGDNTALPRIQGIDGEITVLRAQLK